MFATLNQLSSSQRGPRHELPQPVPLIEFVSKQQVSSSNRSVAIQHVATGITKEAQRLLSQVKSPVYIAAFVGHGRSGKSSTASRIHTAITGDNSVYFPSQSGNVPCTHGIDMLAFRHPSKDGTVLFLDCEGGGNNNQTAIPFVVALAARLANRIYVFERGCFTTAGLDVVMQIMNMGYVTTTHAVEIPRSLVLVENMSINQEIEEEELLEDLLCEEEGDEITNRVRQLIKERFDVEFQKIPFHTLGVPTMHQQAIEVMGDVLADRLAPIALGNVPMDGKMIAHLVNELLAQVRNGGTRFNMTTVTEAMVANMATDAANTIWEGFVSRLRRTGNHPSQINGRKPLPQIMQEVESAANTAIDELEGFVNRLVPSEPAVVAKTIWERNYQHLESSIQATYRQKLHERSQEKTWFEHITAIVNELVQQIVDLVWQIFRMLQTSIRVISFSNRLLLGGSGLLSSISASAAPARSNGGLFGALTQAAGFRLGAPSMFSL